MDTLKSKKARLLAYETAGFTMLQHICSSKLQRSHGFWFHQMFMGFHRKNQGREEKVLRFGSWASIGAKCLEIKYIFFIKITHFWA